jgi:magnesium-transporting ATPase (P-type)
MTLEIPERPQAQPAAVVLKALSVEAGRGLAEGEVTARLTRFGPNRLPQPHRRGPVLRFLEQFHNVLIYILLGAAGVTALLGHWIDMAVIVGVVIVNAVIGFLQEGKAERAIESIRDMLSLRADVLRDSRRIVLSAEALVPGDIVFLQSGDKVPADLRLLRVRNLWIQEAVLTGESVAVEKGVDPVTATAVLGDRSSMAYSGTVIASGQGFGVVVATGSATEIGRIGAMLAKVPTLMTPLLRQIATFGRWLAAAILVLAALTFAYGVWGHGFTANEMFLAAVALAVAAIPEGLPAILTITLAIGVERMARRNALIRRLPAVETLGSVGIICADKTGTLTRNEMTAQTLAAGGRLYEITGEGYDPHGDFRFDGSEAAPEHRLLLEEMARGALLCSDARLRQIDDAWIVEGDPTEGALVTLAMKAGLEREFEAKARPRTDEIPFESEHRFMATLHHDHEGHGFIYVKGAPECILGMCGAQRSESGEEPLDLAYWHARMEEIAKRGQRVLALASKATVNAHRELRFSDLGQGLTLLGLFGLADPPRTEAIAAVRACQAAGIRVKMITGDHAETARAVARRVGLANPDAVLTGGELDCLSDAEFARRVSEVDVFARTSPENKLRLVRAFQADGRVVAMTGDGVNDAPALKRADIGVAMGINGTEAAKEAADMVLADDNFASIAHAVEEGRIVYDNLRKAILYILPTNGGEALTLIAAIVLGQELPVTAVQILWVNMITAVTLALALSFEGAESEVMRRPPRRADEPLLSGFLLWRIAFVSAIILAGTFGAFLWELERGVDIETARTIAVNTLVMFEVFYLFNARFLLAPSATIDGILGSRAVGVAIVLVLVFQLLFTYAPPLQVLFRTRPLDAAMWGEVVAIASIVFFLVEIEKWAIRRFRARPAA